MLKVKDMGLLKSTLSVLQEAKMRMMNAFEGYGRLVAARPWEMIIGTMTLAVSVLSMGVITVKDWSRSGAQHNLHQDTNSSDVLILTITRCIAVIYVYLQFRKFRLLGSKYLLGIAALFTVFSSFVFSLAVINVVGHDLQAFNEALPFFLLLVDLSRACALAKFALTSKSQAEVASNLGHGMAVLGPVVTLDTLVGTLVIGTGTLSGVHKLETMCCFGCMSVVTNFLAFMTFYPATLAILMETLSGSKKEALKRHFDKIYSLMEESDEKKRENPVTNRVKLIMSAGLVMVHVNSRMIADSSGGADQSAIDNLQPPSHTANTYWQHGAQKVFAPGLDYTITACVAFLLLGKYIFFDSAMDKEMNEFVVEFQDLKERDRKASESEQQSNTDESKNNGVVSSAKSDAFVTPTEKGTNKSQSLMTHSSPSIAAQDSIDDIDSSLTKYLCKKEQYDSRAESKDSLGYSSRSKLFTIGESTEALHEQVVDVSTQTRSDKPAVEVEVKERSTQECIELLKQEGGPQQLSDEQVVSLVKSRHIPSYKLETALGDHERGVAIRRKMLSPSLPNIAVLSKLPYAEYDYKYVSGACCENVIGYMPVPVGVAGPLLLDGKHYNVPMATTEGCLVASTNRGCRALSAAGGATSCLLGDGMTRAPVVRFPSAQRASEAKLWLEDSDNFLLVKEAFDDTSRFARLRKLHVVLAARCLYIRFVAVTGDAMGMNMLSKGAERALGVLQTHFSDMHVLSLSGNFCTDKKPSAVNWLEGRGKSVVCEAIVPATVVKNTLKTNVAALVDLNINKNLIGSAMAGSIGGFNAHAANTVAAIYIATGQDPAQTVTSSNCLTVMEASGEDKQDLYISVTMPSIECGTVGGGTVLPPQAACLKMLGVQGAAADQPGAHASRLARVVCATVMASELSLMSALAAGHLVKSHLTHNRSTINMSTSASRKSLPSGVGPS